MEKRLLIAGGSGMIGSALKQEALRQGWEVIILSRHAGEGVMVWDPQEEHILLEGTRSFDAIINLTGASLAGGRWTEKRKKEIVDSRVKSCHTIEKYLREGLLKTNVYVGIAGVGIYGSREQEKIDESSAPDPRNGWISSISMEWETAHKRIETLGIRTVILRTAIVLSLRGGALPEILKTTSFGLISFFGNGRHIWPWIHIQDVVRIMMEAIQDETMQGIYLATAPHPLSNKELVNAINRHLKWRRIVLPVPTFILSILLGKMHTMLMDSCNAYPARLLQHGFVFQFNTIDEAMNDLMARK